MVPLVLSGEGDDQMFVPKPSTKKYEFHAPGMIHGGTSVLTFVLLRVLFALKLTVDTLPMV